MTQPLPKVGFIGSMNAMPMAYALKFRRDGHDVRYVVEAGPDDYLMRPEHQYAAEVRYPYPEWIHEIRWENDLVHAAALPWSNLGAVRAMADRDVVILNDYGIALAPSMPRGALKVAVSSGADIDILCRWQMALSFTASTRRRWLYPLRLVLEIWRTWRQRRGLAHCDIVSYFPSGLNTHGDEVIAWLKRGRRPPEVIERYDANFAAVGVRRVPTPQRPLKRIMAPVRFNLFPPEGGELEYKGNDIILQGIALYRKRNPDIELHVFEKGRHPDLALAKSMCAQLQLDDCTTWHQPTHLPGLLKLYEDGDVVIDQVGSHWMGGVGFYALYMGRPVIANTRLDVFGRLWGQTPPILQATTPEEIAAHLTRCEDQGFRDRVGEASHRFAHEKLDTEAVYQRIRATVLARWSGATAA